MRLLQIAARVAARRFSILLEEMAPEPEYSAAVLAAWDEALENPPEGMSDMDWEEHLDVYFSNTPTEEISVDNFEEFISQYN